MYPRGQEVAQKMYGARGFVAHHNTDLWGDCAPQDSCISSTYWMMGAAWMCTHIWERYEYTLDKEFLREHFHLLRDACLFFVDTLIRDAKARGVKVTAETCPHYLLLTDKALEAKDADYRMNPPLRTQADRQALIEGILDGTVDMIATDHAPHSAQEKARASPGAPWASSALRRRFPCSIPTLCAPAC